MKKETLILHNRLSREELISNLNSEKFNRTTVSFYRYFKIENPEALRDDVYLLWSNLKCFGRIYIAKEGINAQMSIPEHNMYAFGESMKKIEGLEEIPLKVALEDDGKSFYKLTVKVRPKIVADGLSDESFNASNVGKHLTALEFHNKIGGEDTLVIDMRNHYESEIGRFEGAYCPDADTFKEAIRIVELEFKDHKEKEILLYCTGGIRCEKASAYLKHKGFKNVNQLYGGILAYGNEIKTEGLKSKFIGKNFVFDQRLGEKVDEQVIATCHQCGSPCDNHTNCKNDDCHLLFIQCNACSEKYNGCCTIDCKEIIALAPDERVNYRKINREKYAKSQIYRSRIRPKLKELG